MGGWEGRRAEAVVTLLRHLAGHVLAIIVSPWCS